MKLKIFSLTALALLLTTSALTTSSFASFLHESNDELFRHPLFAQQAKRLAAIEQAAQTLNVPNDLPIVQEGACTRKVTFAEPESPKALPHPKQKPSQHERIDSLANVDAMAEVIKRGWGNSSPSVIARIADKDAEVAAKYEGPQERLSDALRKADLLGRFGVNFQQLAVNHRAQKSPPRRTILTGSLYLDPGIQRVR